MQIKVQGNVFAFLQIFNAIPSPLFSAPAELRMINPTTGPYVMLILISYPFTRRAQYILGVRRCRIPSQDGSGMLNLQWRFTFLCTLEIYIIPVTLGQVLHFISRCFGMKPKS